jgi:hypothetical protein
MLTDTCVSMYTMNPTGLSGNHFVLSWFRALTDLIAEYVEFVENEARINSRDRRYLLRPEVVESLFIMYRLTTNETYRDAGGFLLYLIRKN